MEERYSRQVLFPGIGSEGQRKLAAARVALVGCGATGSALASLLARAGVGSIRIIDRDYVEPSNLQRQSLFDESDAAQSLPKAIAAARKIAAFNSQIVVEPQVADLVPANVESLLDGMHLILDGTDNFETRYLLNDFAVKSFPPLDIHSSHWQLRGYFKCAAGENGLSGLSVSRPSAGSLRDLRDCRNSEFRREPGGFDCGHRSDQDARGRERTSAAHFAFVRRLDQRTR